jgi:hypothetical protein
MRLSAKSINTFIMTPAGALVIAVLVVIIILSMFSRPDSTVREGLYMSPVVTINPKISDVQYYNLVAILKDIEKQDPTLSNQFGIDSINLLNIIDSKYTAILGDTGMLTHDKLVALMNIVKTNKPAVLPPFNISIKKYSDVSFGIIK